MAQGYTKSVPIDTSTTLSTNSDLLVPSQKAVKTYIDTKVPQAVGINDTVQFSTIELGHASDTTISRSSAGVIAVEGVTVPLNSITNTHTAQQIELGHASDTTISRSSAGVIAVEGSNVALEDRANTFSVDQRFDGTVNIGAAPSSVRTLQISKSLTANGASTAFAVFANGAVPNDGTTTAAAGYTTALSVASGATATLTHFWAQQNTSSGTISVQSGFYCGASVYQAATNYAFSAANPTSNANTCYAFYSAVNISAGGGTNWAFYGAGTGWSLFNAPIIQSDVAWINAPAPTTKAAAATLTAAELKTQIIICSGTSYNITLPTGTAIDSGFSGIPTTTNIGFDFSLVAISSGNITVVVNTGVTATNTGSLVVNAGTTGLFRLRRTAANTYVLYRIA